ncbi:hypothetical protein PENSPDRAFT_418627, partial [Peniophora sp. CONT]
QEYSVIACGNKVTSTQELEKVLCLLSFVLRYSSANVVDVSYKACIPTLPAPPAPPAPLISSTAFTMRHRQYSSSRYVFNNLSNWTPLKLVRVSFPQKAIPPHAMPPQRGHRACLLQAFHQDHRRLPYPAQPNRHIERCNVQGPLLPSQGGALQDLDQEGFPGVEEEREHASWSNSAARHRRVAEHERAARVGEEVYSLSGGRSSPIW